jgi:hypothetical protein
MKPGAAKTRFLKRLEAAGLTGLDPLQLRPLLAQPLAMNLPSPQ